MDAYVIDRWSLDKALLAAEVGGSSIMSLLSSANGASMPLPKLIHEDDGPLDGLPMAYNNQGRDL